MVSNGNLYSYIEAYELLTRRESLSDHTTITEPMLIEVYEHLLEKIQVLMYDAIDEEIFVKLKEFYGN